MKYLRSNPLLCLALLQLITMLSVAPGLEAAESSKSASPTPQAASKQAEAVKKTKDLPNFHEVHPFLLRSGEPSQAGLSQLKDMGVKTIIDLRAPSECHFDEGKEARKLGMKYIMLTMTSAPPTDEQVDEFLNTVKAAKNDPEKGKVLVHCAHGSDRTGCLLGIWRVVQEGWSYEDAYKEMRKYWFTPKFTKLANAVKARARTLAEPEAAGKKPESGAKQEKE